MLRHVLTTAAIIMLPYVVYGIIEYIRRRRQADPAVIPLKESYWNNAPVLLLGIIGCVLAASVLIGVSVLDNSPGNPAYDPPIHRAAPTE